MKKAMWTGIGFLVVAALLAPIIGPFTFYASVVPVLGPILPRPDGVPADASAEYHWKGFGLVWYWEDQHSGGCAKWLAADGSGGPVRIIDVFEGDGGCNNTPRVVSRNSFSSENTIGDAENESGGEPCPFAVSAEQLEIYAGYIDELRVTNTGKLESDLLSDISERLRRTNGDTLVSYYTRGCRDNLGDDVTT